MIHTTNFEMQKGYKSYLIYVKVVICFSSLITKASIFVKIDVASWWGYIISRFLSSFMTYDRVNNASNTINAICGIHTTNFEMQKGYKSYLIYVKVVICFSSLITLAVASFSIISSIKYILFRYLQNNNPFPFLIHDLWPG
jgi:hypothetical protein